MKRIARQVDVKGNTITIHIQQNCPYCNYILPEPLNILSEGYTSNAHGAVAEHGIYFVLLKCPYCESLILRLFYAKYDQKRQEFSKYGTEKIQHVKIKNVKFPEMIKSISKRFESIYSQAAQAEKRNLDELAGMGYRKALEFLIKDYAIYKFPTQTSKIMKQSLQATLKMIDTHEISVLGQVSTKIGNDETHYYRKHEWEVDDLKNYIESIMVFIVSDLNYSQAATRLEQDRNSKHY